MNTNECKNLKNEQQGKNCSNIQEQNIEIEELWDEFTKIYIPKFTKILNAQKNKVVKYEVGGCTQIYTPQTSMGKMVKEEYSSENDANEYKGCQFTKKRS